MDSAPQAHPWLFKRFENKTYPSVSRQAAFVCGNLQVYITRARMSTKGPLTKDLQGKTTYDAGGQLSKAIGSFAKSVEADVQRVSTGVAQALLANEACVASVELDESKAAVSVVEVEGEAELLPVGSSQPVPLQAGSKAKLGDRIKTGPNARVILKFNDGSIAVIQEQTETIIEGLKEKGVNIPNQLGLSVGEVNVDVPTMLAKAASFKVRTPNSMVSDYGTKFTVRVVMPGPRTIVDVQEGEVHVSPNNESLEAVVARTGAEVQVTDDELTTNGDVVATTEKDRLAGPEPGSEDSRHSDDATTNRRGDDDRPSETDRILSPSCRDLSGQWQQSTAGGVPTTVWTLTAKQDGSYEASERGGGVATGTATLVGSELRIDWRTSGYSGYYEWSLDEDCGSGVGKLVFLSGGVGTHASEVKRLPRGPRLVLREIIHEPNVRFSSRMPETIDLNSKEGFVVFSVPYGNGCRETYRVAYEFDQDLTVLQFGREYGLSVSNAVLKGGCQKGSYNPYVNGTSSNGGSSAVLGNRSADPQFQYKNMVGFIGGNSPRVYAYEAASGGNPVGVAPGKFVIAKYNPNYSKPGFYSWLGFTISAPSNLGYPDSFLYGILFVYEQVN